jgi:3-deoxy-D-arabino-heptulosonate 7-phosphate (DAHP) synthase
VNGFGGSELAAAEAADDDEDDDGMEEVVEVPDVDEGAWVETRSDMVELGSRDVGELVIELSVMERSELALVTCEVTISSIDSWLWL